MSRAVVFDAFGLSHLRVSENPENPPGPGQVRVALRAVSLNYRDLLMVRGHYNPKLAMPMIPCSDGAGEIIAIGAGVEGLQVGDRVCTTMIPDWEAGHPPSGLHESTLGGPAQGVLATERNLPANAVLPLPDAIDDLTACCLPVAGLTAWNALVETAAVGPGDRVLLLGTGGVSMMALGLAKQLGAQVAITSSSDVKLARAKVLGADLTINYREQPKWSKALRSSWQDGVDLVLEVGGAGTFDQSVKATKPGGCVALIGVLASGDHPVNLVPVLMNHIRVQGILVGSRAMFAQYLAFSAEQRPHVEIDKVFQGLDQAAEAFNYLAAAQHLGKVVIRIADP